MVFGYKKLLRRVFFLVFCNHVNRNSRQIAFVRRSRNMCYLNRDIRHYIVAKISARNVVSKER